MGAIANAVRDIAARGVRAGQQQIVRDITRRVDAAGEHFIVAGFSQFESHLPAHLSCWTKFPCNRTTADKIRCLLRYRFHAVPAAMRMLLMEMLRLLDAGRNLGGVCHSWWG